jgi:replicative DNA helicase
LFTLARAKKAMGSAGEPIPTVFKSLASRDFHFRRGQLTLIAAGPGVGKSVLSQTLAMKVSCPALYFSADSDAFTMYKRGASIVTGHRTKDIERDYENGNGEFYDARLNRLKHVRFDFTSQPGIDDLEDCVNAFALTYGEYPHLIVVDNLVNIDGEDLGEGKAGTQSIIQYLKSMAQQTNACVVMLHHLVGAYDDGNEPAPLSALIEKVSKFPEQVITLHRAGIIAGTPSQLGVCIVKNRDGQSDASGGLIVYLEYAPDYARLEDRL